MHKYAWVLFFFNIIILILKPVQFTSTIRMQLKYCTAVYTTCVWQIGNQIRLLLYFVLLSEYLFSTLTDNFATCFYSLVAHILPVTENAFQRSVFDIAFICMYWKINWKGSDFKTLYGRFYTRSHPARHTCVKEFFTDDLSKKCCSV